MTVRKCSTCKHYEPAPIWRKGWCRNPLLYSPQQSHLVGEDDLDCDRGMGNYWEPLDAGDQSGDAGTTHEVAALGNSTRPDPDLGPNIAPLVLSPALAGAARARDPRGGDVSQFSGPGRPGGTGDDDEDVRRSPSYGADPNRPTGGPGGSDRQFTYYTEERYWTDYLRIAAPVLGVILMLGLLWFWISNLLGKPNTPVSTPATGSNPVVITGTPSSSAAVIGTPRPLPTSAAGAQGTPGIGAIAPGAKVVVANTGGAGVRMHSTASTTGKVVATLPDGTALDVTGPSIQADNYTWWPVKSTDKSGYVVANYLKLAP